MTRSSRRTTSGQSTVYAAMLVIALGALPSLSNFAEALDRSIAASAEAHTINLNHQKPSNFLEVPRLKGSAMAVLQVVGHTLVRITDSATSGFALTDKLPSSRTKLFRAAQETMLEGLIQNGYAIVDLRMSESLRTRLSSTKKRLNRSNQEELEQWWHRFAQLEGITLDTRRSRFELRAESPDSFGAYGWHSDDVGFVTTLSVDGLGTQIAKNSIELSPSQHNDLESFITPQQATHYSSEPAFRSYLEQLSKLEGESAWISALEEGSLIAEEGELAVFLGKGSQGALPDFRGTLHRRPKERLADTGDRKLWLQSGEISRWDPSRMPTRAHKNLQATID